MDKEIQKFLVYLGSIKSISRNTEISYDTDLTHLFQFLEGEGITEFRKITKTSLQSYIMKLEEEGKANATISRVIASMKTFFRYAVLKRIVDQDPTETLRPPKVEKKFPEVMTVEEVEKLLAQPCGQNPKEIRDKAMLELLYATGVRVTEMISLEICDVNMDLGYITCRRGEESRSIPFGEETKAALKNYLTKARPQILRDEQEQSLFLNCYGKKMSRQGFWKVIKYYAERAGIQRDITPHTLRHSFAVHMVAGGASLKEVKERLGHADSSTTQMYFGMTSSFFK